MECIVPNCQVHRKRKGATNLPIYSFPKKLIMKEAWLNAIGLKNQQLTGMDGVCSLHFSPNDFCGIPRLHLSTDCASGEEEEEVEVANNRHEIESIEIPDEITEGTTSVGSDDSQIQHKQNVQNTQEIFSTGQGSMGCVLSEQLAQLAPPQPFSSRTPCQALTPNKIVRRFVLVNCTCRNENHETYRLSLRKTDKNPTGTSKETAGLPVIKVKPKVAAETVTTNDASGDRSERNVTLSYEDEEYLELSSSDEETELSNETNKANA